MRKTPVQRCMALLLVPVLALMLTGPAALAADPEYTVKRSSSGYLDPGNSTTLTLVTVSDGVETEVRGVEWESQNPEIASVNYLNGLVTAASAGKTTVTAYLGEDAVASTEIEVSGITVETDPVVVEENGASVSLLSAVQTYGETSDRSLAFTSRDPYIAEIVNTNQVRGLRVGKAVVEATANSGRYRVTLTVQVDPDPSTNQTLSLTLKNGETLPFNGPELSSVFSGQIGGKVEYVTGLFVPTDQGTLYYGYRSESEPGAGVGQVETYYRSPGPGQRALGDVTFVPKPGYVGGNVTITYNAITSEGGTYSCRITFTSQGSSSSSGDEAGSISLNTDYNTAVKFDSIEFGAVCREKLGAQLDYVVFSQPPERQGALYTNYSSSGSYGSLVDIHSQYSRKEIDDVWFVPAPGYNGTVTVYYTGFSTGSKSYSGQVIIKVGQGDLVAIGGLAYDASPGIAVRFDDDDFDEYCYKLLNQEQTLSAIRFEALPSESDGVLYYDYQSSASTGSRAAAGTVYYYGTRAPRIDRLAFVPAEDFTGALRLPFTGWTTDGTSFSGAVEINVRGGVTSGDIYYSCNPGRSVSFRRSDFTSLSQTATGRTLDYIRFQSLPSTSEGSLYYGSSRVSAGTSYYNSNLSQLSFRASNSFSGLVNIPFEGRSTGGDTFSGVITIGSSGGGIGSGNIRYTTDSKTAAVFDRDDFDSLSQWETGRNVGSVRFDLPSSSQGALYRNYYSSSSMGTRITSSTSLTAGELDRVAFVPASGYTGTVYIDFTGTASGSGGTFTGTVEVEVGLPSADVTARYSTRTEPVRFYAGDLARNGASLDSIQFTSLPPSSAGYLYSQYASPIRYGQQASTGTIYRASGSNLISDLAFVPRAGYSGTVTIPYTGTNSSGSAFTGEVVVTVSPSYSSSYFSDMAGYSDAQRAAVDFLYDHNITRGLTSGQYGPESSIRRGDFALMLYQAFELAPTSSGGFFADVPSGAYYAAAVNALYARGVVSGVGSGYYAPESTLTRQDAICMVQRAMRAVGWSAGDGYAGALTGYSDSGSVSGYAQGAMALAIQRGYLPISGTWLNPQQPLTRVDMAEILHRVLTY